MSIETKQARITLEAPQVESSRPVLVDGKKIGVAYVSATSVTFFPEFSQLPIGLSGHGKCLSEAMQNARAKALVQEQALHEFKQLVYSLED